MKLYSMQYAEAKSEAEDPERSLTVRGEEETKKISGAAKQQRIDIDHFFSSPRFKT